MNPVPAHPHVEQDHPLGVVRVVRAGERPRPEEFGERLELRGGGVFFRMSSRLVSELAAQDTGPDISWAGPVVVPGFAEMVVRPENGLKSSRQEEIARAFGWQAGAA
jgi:hypothetical protein